MCLSSHVTLAGEAATMPIRPPASVILEVDPKTNGRFGLPWRSAASRTLASSGASSVRMWAP